MATTTLNQRLDLNSILSISPSAAYKPESFPGLVYRLSSPKTSTLIFSSGSMVCTGARSEKESRRAIFKIIQELKGKGVSIIEKPEVKIVNIVASIDLGGKVDIENSAKSLDKTMYEPEQFPGLIYRMDEPKVVVLLFITGKTVCTGARKEEDVAKAANTLKEVLESKGLISYE